MLRFRFREPSRAAAREPSPPDIRLLALDDGDSVDVRWVRDVRARRLRLIVTDKGVRLTLPVRASERLAGQFLHEHRDWLQQQLRKRPAGETVAFGRGQHGGILLRGERLPLDYRASRHTHVEQGEHGLTLHAPESASDTRLRAALREFYAQQARIDLGRWLPRYLPGLPRAPSAFRFRAMSSLWGSLAPNDAVSLDLSLVLGRPDAFEYVLVHELCHLIHRNHAPRYWREVEARCPQWRQQRDYLHGEGLALKAELRRFR